MAKDEKKPRPKKKRWWSYLGDAYKVTKRSYSWLPWGLLGVALLGLAIGLVPAIITGRWLSWIILAIAFGVTFPLLLLMRLVRKASYQQIDGRPGAVSAVLDNIGRGWNVKPEPVRFNARTQDMVYRALGRPGVVIVSEGPKGRVRGLIEEERKAIKRVAPSAPTHVIMVGNDEGQVKLERLEREMRRLKKQITAQEVAALSYRLDAIRTNNLPIPKGIDPLNARPNRRAMRGK